MTAEEDQLRLQLQTLKASIRTIVHDVSNPLGVLRMTAYYLQSGEREREQLEHYFKVIGDTVEKVAAGLAALRRLGDDTVSGASLPEKLPPPGGGTAQ